jgi:uncharacterized protein (TIGR02996 family)
MIDNALGQLLGFLQTIRANPSDEATWLVFADWMEGQGQLKVAARLRKMDGTDFGMGLVFFLGQIVIVSKSGELGTHELHARVQRLDTVGPLRDSSPAPGQVITAVIEATLDEVRSVPRSAQ